MAAREGNYAADMYAQPSSSKLSNLSPFKNAELIGLLPQLATITAISPNSMTFGSSNVIVSVTGTNFTAGMTCELGDELTATVTYISPTSLTVEVDTTGTAVTGGRPFTLIDEYSRTVTLPDDVFTVTGGTEEPTVSDLFPAAGTPIRPNTPVSFKVTDVEEDLFRQFVTARFPGQSAEEVVYDGYSFTSLYSGSSRTSVSEGYQFTLRRANGWPGPPTIRVFAFDRTGNEL